MSNPYQPPIPAPNHPQPQPSGQGDATGGVIPYKNPHALTAYYLGIGFLICCITPLPLGLIPLVLGIMGLHKRAQNPVIKGSVHAWIGIVLGGFSAFGSVLVVTVWVLAALNQR